MVKGHTARDFVTKWRNEYRLKVGAIYRVHWAGDTGTFKKLMSDYSRPLINQLIEFCFSGHPSTRWFASQGYNIVLLPSQVNRFLTNINVPQSNVEDKTLKLDIPYNEDSRTAHMWASIQRSDLESLIENVDDERHWKLLMAKLQHQKGFVPKKVMVYFEWWKNSEMFERKARVREDRSDNTQLHKA